MSADQPEWTAPPEAVIAFLDGDGCDDEVFASLRRRITLAVPYILDSEVGRDYAVTKLAEAEKRGAVKALRAMANELAEQGQSGWAVRLQGQANRIESGEVTLP